MTEAEIKQLLDQLSDLQSQIDLIGMEKQKLIETVLTPEIKQALQDIDAEFTGKVEAVQGKRGELEQMVKTAVVEFGASVKGNHFHAVYNKGHITWNAAFLDKLIQQFPEVGMAKDEGKPSVSIRSVK